MMKITDSKTGNQYTIEFRDEEDCELTISREHPDDPRSLTLAVSLGDEEAQFAYCLLLSLPKETWVDTIEKGLNNNTGDRPDIKQATEDFHRRLLEKNMNLPQDDSEPD